MCVAPHARCMNSAFRDVFEVFELYFIHRQKLLQQFWFRSKSHFRGHCVRYSSVQCYTVTVTLLECMRNKYKVQSLVFVFVLLAHTPYCYSVRTQECYKCSLHITMNRKGEEECFKKCILPRSANEKDR